MCFEEVDEIIERHRYEKSALIAVLQDVQKEENWLPQDMLKHIAKRLDVPLTRVYGIASFYKAFSLKPRGKHLINVCLGTACHVRGAVRTLDRIKRTLGIEPDETTEDLNFTLETVNCLGCCALGPVMVVDGDYHGKMSPAKIKETLESYE